MNSSSEVDVVGLVLLCKAGDDDAFEKLVALYNPMLLKTARDLSLDVRDVYSDACLSLKRAAQSYKLDSELTFGLYAKICVNRAMIDYRRRTKGVPDGADFDVDDVAVSDGVQSRLEKEEETANLDKWAKDVLSELEYEVFRLSMMGYKPSEIAEKLSISQKSADNAKSRMLKRLRAELDTAPKN